MKVESVTTTSKPIAQNLAVRETSHFSCFSTTPWAMRSPPPIIIAVNGARNRQVYLLK